MFSLIIYYHCCAYVRIMCPHDCVCVCVCENQVSVGVSHQPKLSSVCHQSVLNCVYAFLPLPHLPSWCCDKSVFLICLDAFPCQQVIPKVVNSVGAQGSDIFLGIWLQLLMLGWLMSYFYQHLGSMFICVHAHTHTHTHTHTPLCMCVFLRERERGVLCNVVLWDLCSALMDKKISCELCLLAFRMSHYWLEILWILQKTLNSWSHWRNPQ